MKRFIWIITIVFSLDVLVVGQKTIQTEAFQWVIHEMYVFHNEVSYLTPPQPHDQPAVRLYKQYFNPASYQAFRDFFLPADWPGSSKSDFDKWQSFLHLNNPRLEKILRLQNEFNNEFIICHFMIETIEYMYPGTAIFKKTNQGWKHISFINDPEAGELKQIGLLRTAYLESIVNEDSPAQLRNMQVNNSISPTEKFDRSKLFSGVRQVLKSRNVSDSDLILCEKLFIEKAEVEMVQYIGQAYTIDVFDLMGELNEVIGFSLYKFVNTAKIK